MSETMKNEPSKSLAPLEETRIVMPAVSATEAVESWNAYQDLKKRIAEPSDIQKIGSQEFLKKSYWRKIATFFNLTVTTVEESKELLPDAPGHWVYNFTVRAKAPNGREVDGVASCDAYEKATLTKDGYKSYNNYKKSWSEALPNSLHNVRSTAYTRAFNRAVSDLVGGGEVSADEIVDVDRDAGFPREIHTKGEAATITRHQESDDWPEETVQQVFPGATVSTDEASEKQVYAIRKGFEEKGFDAERIAAWFEKNAPLSKAKASETIKALKGA